MQVNLIKNFAHESCYKCGIDFYVPERIQRHLLASKESFWCPNGHSQAYVKSTSETLKEELSQKELKILRLQTELNTALRNQKKPKKKK